MKLSTMIQTAAASAALFGAVQAQALSVTDTMTNTVTVADACDVAATGVNFGVLNSALSSAVTTYTANTDSKGTPSLGSTGLTALDTAVSTALSSLQSVTAGGITGGLGVGTPGVYVLCTTTPSSITLSSPSATTANLLTASTLSAVDTLFSSKMTSSGGSQINYNLHIAGLPTSTVTGILNGLGLPVRVFAGAYLVVPGTTAIPAQTLPAAGVYTDTVTATVNF